MIARAVSLLLLLYLLGFILFAFTLGKPAKADAPSTDAAVVLTGGYVSLTFPALERARGVVWLVVGTDKADALARLVAGDASIPAGRVPQAHALAIAGDVLGKVAKLRSRDLAP